MSIAEKFVLMVTPAEALSLRWHATKAGDFALAEKIRVAYDLWKTENDLQDEWDREPY